MWDGSVEAHNNYKFFLDYDRRCDLPVNLPHGHSLWSSLARKCMSHSERRANSWERAANELA
ncbi:hypothetical protein BD310DRAFT_1017459, partial [Dichomitus squalens]